MLPLAPTHLGGCGTSNGGGNLIESPSGPPYRRVQRSGQASPPTPISSASTTRATRPYRARSQSKSRAHVQSSPPSHSPAALRLLGWRWPWLSSPSRQHSVRRVASPGGGRAGRRTARVACHGLQYTCTRAGMCVMSHVHVRAERHVWCVFSPVRSFVISHAHILERDGCGVELRGARRVLYGVGSFTVTKYYRIYSNVAGIECQCGSG